MPDYHFTINWAKYPTYAGQTHEQYYHEQYSAWLADRSGINPDGSMRLSRDYRSDRDSTNSGGRRMRYKSTRRRGKTNRRRVKTHRRRHRKH
jgi:hypothetical protein